jgi:hypothetical protein
MGNSKVIWTAGVSLIIGLYAMGIKTAEQNSLNSTVHYANAVNLEELGKSGFQMAKDELSSENFRPFLSAPYIYTKVVGGDTIRYSITPNDADTKRMDFATVRVNVSSNGASMELVATWQRTDKSKPKHKRSRWAVLSRYTSVM